MNRIRNHTGKRSGPVMKLALAMIGIGISVVSSQAQTGAVPAVSKSVKVGAGLYEVVASASSDSVYVASTGPGREGSQVAGGEGARIYVLDGKTLAVKSSIDVASAPAFGIALNDKTQMLYTSNTRSGSVSAIDAKTGKIVATIKDDADPRAHLFQPFVDEDSDTIYVSVAASPSKIWVIDGKTNQMSHVLTDVGNLAIGLAIDKAAKRLYAASSGTNEIVEIDLTARKVSNRYPAGGQRPSHIAFDAATKRLFIANQGTGDMTVLDTSTGKIVKTVKTGAGALGATLNPNTKRLYVANRQAGTVTVIDTTTYEVVADLKGGTLPNTVAINHKTNMVYVTNKARSAGRGAAAKPLTPEEESGGDTLTMITP